MKVLKLIKSMRSKKSLDMRTLAPGIEVFESNFPRWQEVIDQSERSVKWIKAWVRKDELDDKLRKNDIHPFEEDTELQKLLVKHYIAAFAEYAKKYQFAVVNQLEPFQIARYEVGGHYTVHADAMGTKGGDRIVSSVLYLNDNYEGGELYFPQFDVSYKPTAGSLVLFPSYYTYEHCAKPVKKGTKYCVLSWYIT